MLFEVIGEILTQPSEIPHIQNISMSLSATWKGENPPSLEKWLL